MALGPEHDVKIEMTIPPDAAMQAIQERPYLFDLTLKMEAWIGEFGELDMATAFTAALVRVTYKRRERERAAGDGGGE